MTPPAFWTAPRPTWTARALQPLGALYGFATARRVARGPRVRTHVPVICVGNLTAGGAGKTPTVIALIERLAARGIQPVVVTRGYGGQEVGPLRVDPIRHKAHEVGDEPLLLAAFTPVWVARDRAAGAAAAEADGAGCLILDDGFQNPDVAKDLSIVVADADTGFGNGLCLPAGPLREPVAAGLKRADLLLTIGAAPGQHAFSERWGAEVGAMSRLTGSLEPLAMGLDWAGLRVFAFAGIGRPAKFFRSLADQGAEVVGAEPLADHQALSPTLLARLSRAAKAQSAQLVTTEKDAVRLPPDWRSQVLTFPVRLRIDDWSGVDARLDRLGL